MYICVCIYEGSQGLGRDDAGADDCTLSLSIDWAAMRSACTLIASITIFGNATYIYT